MKRDCDFMVTMEYNFEPRGPRRDRPRDGGHGFLPAGSCGRGSKEGSHVSCHPAATLRLAPPSPIAREIGGLLSLDDLASLFPSPPEVVVVKDERFLGRCWGGRSLWKPPSGPLNELFVLRILCEVGLFLGIGPVVIKFPLSGSVMNCPMVKSPYGNMARLFDGKGWAVALFHRIDKPWDQTDAVKIADWGEIT